ncbi:MAG: hypothetical protein JSW07_11900 [bacterium]|nr:MAG: hypothetical protein JSW07_11900 [bacterium]
MGHIKEIIPIYIKSFKSFSPHGENTIREQLLKENPKLANNPHRLRKEVLKRVEKKLYIDSSYYLG